MAAAGLEPARFLSIAKEAPKFLKKFAEWATDMTTHFNSASPNSATPPKTRGEDSNLRHNPSLLAVKITKHDLFFYLLYQLSYPSLYFFYYFLLFSCFFSLAFSFFYSICLLRSFYLCFFIFQTSFYPF